MQIYMYLEEISGSLHVSVFLFVDFTGLHWPSTKIVFFVTNTDTIKPFNFCLQNFTNGQKNIYIYEIIQENCFECNSC